MSKIASLLTCDILSLRSMDDHNFSLMGHDAVFIGNLLPSFQGRFFPFLQGYNCWKGLITLFGRVENRFYNVALENGPPLWSSGQSFWLQIQRSRVRFPALPDFLISSGSGTGYTHPREVN